MASILAVEDFPITHREGAYWIEPIGAVADERIGPYKTVAEAESDRRGVLRFLRRQDAGLNPFE